MHIIQLGLDHKLVPFHQRGQLISSFAQACRTATGTGEVIAVLFRAEPDAAPGILPIRIHDMAITLTQELDLERRFRGLAGYMLGTGIIAGRRIVLDVRPPAP